MGSCTSHGTLYVYDQGTTHSVMSVFAVFLALLLKNLIIINSALCILSDMYSPKFPARSPEFSSKN